MAHLLLVDDEDTISRQLERRLKAIGHSIVGCATNAADSIDMAREYQPDLVFMDIVMPGEMDGIDAAQIISREYQIPVIFLTAWADDETVSRAKQSNPYGFILKPYHIDELKAVIDLTLHRSNLERKIADAASQFKPILDLIDVLFISIDDDLNIHHVNRAAASFLGSTADALKGTPITGLVAEHTMRQTVSWFNDCFTMYKQNRGKQQNSTISLTFRKTGSAPVILSMSCIPCYTPMGYQVCLMGTPDQANTTLHCAICSHCKRIRNVQDEWIHLESYLSTTLDISFSHSICPTCIKKYYPDLTD